MTEERTAVGSGILPKCPKSQLESGEHELDYYDPEQGTCPWCGKTAERCPECSVLLELHHDPGCTQPCARCEAAKVHLPR
jgi:hypothetical protein